jgi:hypothetical protein
MPKEIIRSRLWHEHLVLYKGTVNSLQKLIVTKVIEVWIFSPQLLDDSTAQWGLRRRTHTGSRRSDDLRPL